MAQESSGVQETVARWRKIIMEKRRQIITPEETLDLKISAIQPWIYPDAEDIGPWEFRQFHYTRKRERVFQDESWKPIEVGGHWGGPDVSAQFRCRVDMPARFAGKKVVLKLYFGGDGLLTLNGRPYHGLDPLRDTVPLTESAEGGATFDLEIESYVFWHFGESEEKTLEVSQFAVADQEVNGIYWDFRCAYKVMMTENVDPEVREHVQAVLHAALASFDQNETDPAAFHENLRKAHAVLKEGLYDSELYRQEGLLHLVGNSHLDVCYLWTQAEFVRKLGRTHATVLRLMEQYPEYVFSQSQPLIYEEMKQNYPQMYEEVKARIAEGRWEVVGAFWIEPDANLISGESFLRQLIYGIRFIQREFNITPRTAWIPDVFGVMWTLPQLLVQCGLDYFVTHKMVMWNDTNPWRHHVFWWEGPDGSRMLTVVPPTHFIGTMEPGHLADHWQTYSAKHNVGESLYNYGWGDGGGGPDAEMLEGARRFANFPGMPPLEHSTNERCLDRIHAAAAEARDIPVINDELYLEEHRGTFTTKAIFKKLNRKCELLYRKAELFACLAGDAYPKAQLEEGWKVVLNNQFHDSLPGSHVRIVHEDIEESYQAPVAAGELALSEALAAIAGRIDTRGGGTSAAVVFNAHDFVRDTIAYLDFSGERRENVYVSDEDGDPVVHQIVDDFHSGKKMLGFVALGLPPCGYRTYQIHRIPKDAEKDVPEYASPLRVTDRTLDNERVRATFNGRGELVSLFDKETQRECIETAKGGNVFQLFEDEPGKLEAWDIVSTYADHEYPMDEDAVLRAVEEGPLRGAIEIERTFRNSRIVQRVVLGRDSKRLDFETFIDWREQKKLLKVRFHTTIRSRTAAYDIPFGVIERPATRNNSYEEAKFEVPAHLWMDFSQADFGLSLLNDCKYGHEADGQMIGLTLLKGATWPDPIADQGEHHFTYSLYPHGLTWREAQTHQQALDLNDPVDVAPVAHHAGELTASRTFLSVEAPNVHVEALKQAEDGADWILRVVERQGARANVTVRTVAVLDRVAECSPLEDKGAPLEHEAHAFRFTIHPFQVRSFRLGIGKRA